MIDVSLSDDLYYELKGYLERKLSNAKHYLHLAKKDYEYYKEDIEDEEDEIVKELKYFQKEVKKYNLALELFKE